MRFRGTTVFVTGGAGFIGSAVIRHLLDETEANVVNIDKLTYAAKFRTQFRKPRTTPAIASPASTSAMGPSCGVCSRRTRHTA